MKNRKTLLMISFAIAAVMVVSQAAFAEESNGNNGNGMMQMMNNEGTQKMMNAMNTPEGQEMMNACGNFMESYDAEDN